MMTAALVAYSLAASIQPVTAADKIKLGILKLAGATVAWVANTNGIFQKNGLDVETVEFRNGAEAIAANRSGAIDVILSIPGTVMTANERGFDLMLVVQNETAYPEGPDSGAILVLPDSPIKSASDLAGKRVAVTGLHSQNTVAVLASLSKAGVDPKSLQLMEVPLVAMGDTLRAKHIDAAASLDPWTTKYMKFDGLRNVSWYFVESLPQQPVGSWFAKAGFIKDNKEKLTRFVASIREAIDYMNADAPRARHAVATFTGLDTKLVESMPLNKFNWHVDIAVWQSVVDMMQKNGELQQSHQASEYISELAR
jgi:NitT/TauT family transport system substrate-binding protein